MTQVIWSTWHECGTTKKEKIWVPDRNWTHDLLVYGRSWASFLSGSHICSLSHTYVMLINSPFIIMYCSPPVMHTFSIEINFRIFQFDLDYCQAIYHEPLAQVITQALPVFDIKFTFYFFMARSSLFWHPDTGIYLEAIFSFSLKNVCWYTVIFNLANEKCNSLIKGCITSLKRI